MAAYVFLDESGDLGFNFDKPGVTNNFIVTLLLTKDVRKLERTVKNVTRWVKRRHKKHIGCLHAYHEDPATRKKLLQAMVDLDCQVIVIRLNKHKVYTRLHDEKQVLYNYVTNILLDRLIERHALGAEKTIHLIAAKRETNKFLNVNFQDYLRRQVKGSHQLDLSVEICAPGERKGIQAVDMLSWAMFRKIEHGDNQYFSIVRKLIIETSLFP